MFRARGIVVPALLALAGCTNPQTVSTSRSQSEDAANPRDSVRTVGELSAFSNVQPIPVSGVGLVYGLDGTGHSPPGFYRDMLEREMKKNGIRTPSDYLDSPNQALVLVSALIPPGARKGDLIHLQVTLPDGSKATSLRGGRLADCELMPFDTASNISSRIATAGGDRLLMGTALARGEGTLTVDVRRRSRDADGEPNPNSERVARVWNGGRCTEDRPMYLTLDGEHQRARLAAEIAARINERFSSNVRSDDVAEAKTKEAILLRVPPQYRHNLPRYMRVVRMIPLESVPTDHKYRHALENELLDASSCVTAALRLEALGEDSKHTLRVGLDSAFPLVRFSCAESLAYLGDLSGSKELARLAAEHPALQAYCLTALASLNEPVSVLRLQEMLDSESAELRYGAFRALRELDPRLTLIRGEPMKTGFWLHRLSPGTRDMVHVRTEQRAEIAIFGNGPRLQAPFSVLVGQDFTLTAGTGDEVCTVSRFSTRTGKQQLECSFSVEDVVRTLGELGADYADVVDMLRAAEANGSLSCRLIEDVKPQGVNVFRLAELGGEDPTLSRATEVARGDTPTLYE